LSQRDKIFSDIVQQHHGSIYRICLAYLYDRSHADDLYQEILVQVWKSLDSYKGTAQLGTWIYRIAVNTAITYNIKNKKTKLEELPEAMVVADEPGNAKERESQLSQLAKAINQLEEQDRLLISLVLEDLSYKEIAEITGGNVNSTGVRITRVKARLLKLMTNKTDDDGL
jgi:RNA polymerase sigma-70 factor (ECF subfamily)